MMRTLLAFILTSTAALSMGSCRPDAGKVDPTTTSNAIARPELRESFTAEPTPEATRPELVLFGDSITAGYGVDPGLTFPDDLQTLLDQAGYHFRAVNAGVSGDTSKDAVERLPHIIARKPNIVVVEFGGNDGLRGIPVPVTQANLAEVIHTLQQVGIKVALVGITLPPQYGHQYIAHFDAMYVTLARRFQVPLMPFVLQGVYGVPGSIQNDGIHPTAQGDKLLAANMLHFLEPMLSH